MWMSMRSSSGPEILRDVALTMRRRAGALAGLVAEVAAGAGVHGGDEHEARGEADRHGGARDGDGAVLEGLAQDFEDVRGNSGSSSRKSTPLWARETSPGRGMLPPPMRPASEMVWCGERKGRCGRGRASRRGGRRRSGSSWSRALPRATAAARMEGRRLASMVLPVPGGPMSRMLWPPAAATSSARLATCWPRTSAKSAGSPRRSLRGALLSTCSGGAKMAPCVRGVEQLADLAAARSTAIDVEPRDGGLPGVLRGMTRFLKPAARAAIAMGSIPCTARSARRGQFADEDKVGDVLDGSGSPYAPRMPMAMGEVEAGAFFLEVGGREIDGDAANTKTNSFKDVNCTT